MSKEIKAINVTDRDEGPNKAGEFAYVLDFNEKEICGMNIFCPCGCEGAGMLMFNNYTVNGTPKWDWDGNEDMPTLRPSILRRSDCKWHGFLTDGIFREC